MGKDGAFMRQTGKKRINPCVLELVCQDGMLMKKIYDHIVNDFEPDTFRPFSGVFLFGVFTLLTQPMANLGYIFHRKSKVLNFYFMVRNG